MKRSLLSILSLCLLVVPVCGQSVHSFNSGMNCYGNWTLPDTSTHPFSAAAGDDASYQPVISSPSYTLNGDGTTTDNVTGLMWVSNPGAILYTWANALSSCTANTIGNMNYGAGFANHTDWRLPNVRELLSIADFGGSNPAIAASFFPGTQANYYWTSTTYMVDTTYAFRVGFTDGGSNVGVQKTTTNCVRCVRGGP